MATLKVEPPALEGYEFVRHLGSGGYSEVFLYLDQRLGRQVAVKVLTEGGTEDEARAMAAVSSHTHIVDIYRTDVTAEGLPYLVMQYYPGATFAQRVRRGPLPVAEVLKLGVELSGALEHAHQAGVRHRDIKPANILTSASNRPGLTDFGIASHAGAPRDQVSMSLPWVPPEVLEGRDADERGDIYSLAATLFTLLEGRAPFVLGAGDDGDDAVVRRTLGQDPPRVTASVVPESLDALLRSAMAKRPDDRPARAETFGRALQAIEAELKLNRTPLEVPTAHGGGFDEEPELGDEPDGTKTRARSVRVVEPAGPDDLTRTRSGLDGGLIDRVPMRPKPALPGDRARRARLPVPEPPPLEDTRSRAPEPADPVAGEAGRDNRAAKVIGAIAAVALVAVVALVGLGGRSGDDEQAAGSPEESTMPTIETAVPRVKDLSMERTGDETVKVSWVYPSFAAGDTYLWQRCDREAGDLKIESTTEPMVELSDVPSGIYPCVAVRVQRADGRESDVEQVTLR